MRPKLPVLLGLLVASCANAAQATSLTMFRDPGCPCCEKWADHLKEELGYEIIARDEPAIDELKTKKSVPAHLAACHTMGVEGYVLEMEQECRSAKIAESRVSAQELSRLCPDNSMPR